MYIPKKSVSMHKTNGGDWTGYTGKATAGAHFWRFILPVEIKKNKNCQKH
jgi:hypothetical protein